MKLGWSLYWRTLMVHVVLVWAVSTVTSTILRSGEFIKLGPSISYGCLSAALGISLMLSKEGLIHVVAGPRLSLPFVQWRRFTVAIASLFASLMLANLVVAFTQSTEFWVNFKLTIGILPFLFTMAYGVWLQRQPSR